MLSQLTGSRMSRDALFENLWTSTRPSSKCFDPAELVGLPIQARRYLQHAITAQTLLASAVRLTMHGEIKLRGWRPFSAEEIICWGRGMIWRAAVKMRWISIRGGDSFIDGVGAMRWKLFGVIPIVSASGPDITRSAAGRTNIESVWLPSALCDADVTWTGTDESHLRAQFLAHGEPVDIAYVVDGEGRLRSVSMPRWGNPEDGEFHYATCGGLVEAEGQFGGYTIPTRMRVGWHFGTERFNSEGEFFRVTIDNAIFR
jgi:hypothetical protein